MSFSRSTLVFTLFWRYYSKRAIRIVYDGDTSTFKGLLDKDNSIKTYTGNLPILVTKMFKVKEGIAPPFLEEIFKL